MHVEVGWWERGPGRSSLPAQPLVLHLQVMAGTHRRTSVTILPTALLGLLSMQLVVNLMMLLHLCLCRVPPYALSWQEGRRLQGQRTGALQGGPWQCGWGQQGPIHGAK